MPKKNIATSLWLMVILFTPFFSTGCDRDKSVTLIAGDIVGDNGTLLYQGQEYTGTQRVSVQKNDLVGALMNGKPYLYCPLLGDVALSENTSRKAVAYSLLGSPADSQALPSMVQTAASSTPVELEKGETVTLQSMVKIKRMKLLNPALDKIEVKNLARRWVACKLPDGTVKLIPPAGKAWDSNACRWLTSQKLQIPAWMLDGDDPESFFASLDTIQLDVTPGEIQIFGAVWQIAPQAKLSSSGWPPSTDEAWKADYDLYWWLNAYGFAYFLGEGVRNFISTLSIIECFDAAIVTFFNKLNSFFGSYLDPSINEFFDQVQDEDLRNSFNGCLAIIPTLGRSEIVSSFFDFVALFDWFTEDIITEYAHLLKVKSFDTVKITEKTSGCDASQYLSFRAGDEEITDQTGGQYCESDLYIKNTSPNTIWLASYIEDEKKWSCAVGYFLCESLEPGEEVTLVNNYKYWLKPTGECVPVRTKKFIAVNDTKACEAQFHTLTVDGTMPSGVSIKEYDADVCRCY